MGSKGNVVNSESITFESDDSLMEKLEKCAVAEVKNSQSIQFLQRHIENEGLGLLGEAQVFAGKAISNNYTTSDKLPHEPVSSPFQHGLSLGLLIFEELVNEIVDGEKDMGLGFTPNKP
ncbi:hypothetical protein CRYUN_Cryun13aG0034100 [Craigia yunnanensis]